MSTCTWWCSVGKESTCNAGNLLQCWRCGCNLRVGKICWRRKWQPTPVFLTGKSHGQRRLAGYKSMGWQESDTTQQLNHPYHPCAWWSTTITFSIFPINSSGRVELSKLCVCRWEKTRPNQRQLSRRNCYCGQGEEGQPFCPPQAFKSIHLAVLSRFSGVHLFVIQWTVDCQAPLSMRFSR